MKIRAYSLNIHKTDKPLARLLKQKRKTLSQNHKKKKKKKREKEKGRERDGENDQMKSKRNTRDHKRFTVSHQ